LTLVVYHKGSPKGLGIGWSRYAQAVEGKNFGLKKIGHFIFRVGHVFKNLSRENGGNEKCQERNESNKEDWKARGLEG
jgi:hypothetical protein